MYSSNVNVNVNVNLKSKYGDARNLDRTGQDGTLDQSVIMMAPFGLSCLVNWLRLASTAIDFDWPQLASVGVSLPDLGSLVVWVG